MRPLTTTLSGLALAALTAITPAMAQNPQADYATCDAYARQTVQPYLNQANAQGVGSAPRIDGHGNRHRDEQAHGQQRQEHQFGADAQSRQQRRTVAHAHRPPHGSGAG